MLIARNVFEVDVISSLNFVHYATEKRALFKSLLQDNFPRYHFRNTGKAGE